MAMQKQPYMGGDSRLRQSLCPSLGRTVASKGIAFHCPTIHRSCYPGWAKHRGPITWVCVGQEHLPWQSLDSSDEKWLSFSCPHHCHLSLHCCQQQVSFSCPRQLGHVPKNPAWSVGAGLAATLPTQGASTSPGLFTPILFLRRPLGPIVLNATKLCGEIAHYTGGSNCSNSHKMILLWPCPQLPCGAPAPQVLF